MTEPVETPTEWVVWCAAHQHYLKFVSVSGTTWTAEQAEARGYTKHEAIEAARRATWLDHNPTPWAIAPGRCPMPAEHKPEKMFIGHYRYRGRLIIRTSWEGTGPRGGTRYLWELGDEDKYGAIVLSSTEFFPTMREAVKYLDEQAPTDWAVVACDGRGITVDKTGPDPETLANEVASWAQQEADKWPDFGLIYMLVPPEEAVLARTIEEEEAHAQGT